jgi:folate-dependent tRNA-U54 methylase TrmFO/GidA
LPPLTAEDLLEQLRAETRLSKIDLFEDLAALYEEERVPKFRQDFAQRYGKAVGVAPEQREEFKEALEGIVAGGRQSVANLIDVFNRERHANGSSPPLAG